MNPEWIKQADLEKKFACYGHFYSIVANNIEYSCRSVLEIVSVNLKFVAPNDLSDRTPDATAIMMNPGSSEPVHTQNNRVEMHMVGSMDTDLVLTCPDNTQSQIMRIMECKNWEHVRVLNLSDLRNPDSGKFYEYYPRVESETGSDAHSIFSELRDQELKMKLHSSRPVIAAWGVSPKLDRLIDKCVRCNLGNVVGKRKSNSAYKYYHPLPRRHHNGQREWLNSIYKELG